MKIQMLQVWSGPLGSFGVGAIVDVPDAQAIDMIERNYAKPLESFRRETPPEVVEKAEVAPKPERAVIDHAAAEKAVSPKSAK